MMLPRTHVPLVCALGAASFASCVAPHAEAPGANARSTLAAVELVESWPVGTSFDHADIPDTFDVWIEMIDGAEERLDFAQFYASNEPGSPLEDVVRAIERAADRGVHVRWLAEEMFYETYPETLERLNARDNVDLRRFDVAALMGGVLHAKYFIVDDREAFLGSQNFDWRALEHIQELGVRVRVPTLVRAFSDVFDADWKLAGGAPRGAAIQSSTEQPFPLHVQGDVGEILVTPVFSPRGWLPDESSWDLPHLIELIDSAQSTLRVQLLSFRTRARDGTTWTDLDDALRRAAARNVRVELLLADWSKRRGTIEALQSLQRVPNIEVRLVTIPINEDGFIPFGRVIHAKYVVVDGQRAWIGTSNWEKSYFHTGRNVGLLVDGAEIAGDFERFFQTGWTSEYAELVDPLATYEAPRIGE